MKILMKYIFLFLGILFCSNVFAEKISNEKKSEVEQVYKVDQNKSLSLMSRILLADEKIGKFENVEKFEMSEKDFSSMYKATARQLKESTDKLNNLLQNKKIDEPVVEITSKNSNEVELPAVLREESEFDVLKFRQCLTAVLPAYQKYLLIDTENPKIENAKLVEFVNFDRGLEKSRNPDGIVCGFYLGNASFVKLDKINEFKFLEASLLLDDEKLLKYISYYHLKDPFIGRALSYVNLSIVIKKNFEVLEIKSVLERVKNDLGLINAPESISSLFDIQTGFFDVETISSNYNEIYNKIKSWKI